MCGVVAVIALRGELPHRETLVRMRDALAHRGPDDASLEIVDGRIALGHRRLSIIDIAGSPQPLRSEDEQTIVIFNGEIYNFVELRARLSALGACFRTAGDGEVIVQGYRQWGDQVFAKLEGMFTAVIVDRRRRRVIAARDRFGIKPLVYCERDGLLIVASEIKAILAGLPAPPASETALALGSIRMHVPWPYTAFHGIYRLPPGAALIVEDDAARLVRFAPLATSPSTRRSDPEAAHEVVQHAIRRQMVADVPVGAFLSGGIDSSLIVTMMREIASGEIHAFSLQTDSDPEAAVAAETAAALGVIHHTVGLDAIQFDDIAELPRLYDEPFAETSALGVRALSRYARDHVKVALSGDGGDEVFGGYLSYRQIHYAQAIALPARQRLSALAHDALQRRAHSPFVRRMLRAALLVADVPEEAQRDMTTLNWCAAANDREISEALSRQIAARSNVEIRSRLQRAMFADRFERLSNAMLAKVDIASMSASLEVRVPMLDDDLVAYADGLPTRSLISLRWGKIVLRRLVERSPVGRLAWETKRGFTLPLDRWLRIPRISMRMSQLLGDHARLLADLCAEDVPALWRGFLAGGSRFSAGTAAMLLLWYASVALWASQHRVASAVADRTPPLA